MVTPTSLETYAEVDHASTTEQVSDNQPTDPSANSPSVGFRGDDDHSYLSAADIALMQRRPSSSKIAAGLSVPRGAATLDHFVRLDRDRNVTAVKAPLNNARVEPEIARSAASRARHTLRPLSLVPRLKRPHPEFLRARAAISLMGVRIDCVTERQVLAVVMSSIRDGRGGWIVTPNVDHLRIINQRPELLAMLSEASMIIADGMPLIWASWLRGTPLPERVPGAGLILSLSAAASRAGASIFLLGGNPGEGEATAAVLKSRNRALKIAGVMCPPIGFDNDPLRMAEIGDSLRSAKPDIVYSCFGFPKEQFVIQALRHHLPSAWFLGLGGSFAIVSGRTRRAPSWLQLIGMEWLWRLGLEPRRLFRRYIVNDLPFAIRMLVSSAVQL